MELNLTLPLPTSINKLYINQYTWSPKSKTRVPTGKRIMGDEGKKVKSQIQKETIKQIENQDWSYEFTKENYIYMDTIIYMNRKGRDDNNIYKLLADSLEKIVYDNDSRVLIRTQRILYDQEQPRVQVHLSPVPFVGIFDNQEQLNKFESKCEKCKWHKNNCQTLQKAKEGRIQKEIDDNLNCSRYSEPKSKKK